jgi:hypothetical protein
LRNLPEDCTVAVLTDAERLVLQGRLDDANSKYHLLMTGKMARVFVDQNGERVEFTATTKGALYAYITSLQAQLAPCGLEYTGPRPLGFIF